jgi:hypothetical protein
MESFLESMGQQLFNRSREVSSDNQLCISCGTDAKRVKTLCSGLDIYVDNC